MTTASAQARASALRHRLAAVDEYVLVRVSEKMTLLFEHDFRLFELLLLERLQSLALSLKARTLGLLLRELAHTLRFLLREELCLCLGDLRLLLGELRDWAMVGYCAQYSVTVSFAQQNQRNDRFIRTAQPVNLRLLKKKRLHLLLLPLLQMVDLVESLLRAWL